ncbi:polyprenyl synthetase family protein [Thermaerobacter sp. PB12/4term]|uniref:polyprenyl synthetase family protein n=1 Tax=Thermaerobacter sp. PB12/4term TaxID=2293838 RepID=UPI001FAC4C71|nr:farnesyl diphosphate synthase [Thermaerobacter sp. PB12/4term]
MVEERDGSRPAPRPGQAPAQGTGGSPAEAATRRREVDELVLRARRALDQVLPPVAAPPSRIHEAMRYSALAGGKALRPVLLMAAARCVGGPQAVTPAVERAAAAVELVHTYSLIHDDLPAMDDDDMRRGQPASHVVFGEAMAILAGDALLTLAFEVLAGLPRWGADPAVALAVVEELAVAAGTAGLIGGQVDDLAATTATGLDLAGLQSIHRRKTGALFRACVRMGARLAGATAAELEALTAFATAFGEAFQIVDDILDVTGDEAELGKPVGSDARQGKVTVPGLVGLEAARRLAAAATERAVASLEPLGGRAGLLAWLARDLLERRR